MIKAFASGFYIIFSIFLFSFEESKGHYSHFNDFWAFVRVPLLIFWALVRLSLSIFLTAET